MNMVINGMSESLVNSLAELALLTLLGLIFYFRFARRSPEDVMADERRRLARKAKKMAH